MADVLGSILDVSHTIHPDDLPTVVSAHAGRLGASRAVVYVVDHEQRTLIALPPDKEVLEIDATLAGRVYRTAVNAVGQGEGQDGAVRLWAPLLDGADRLGVMAFDLPSAEAAGEQRWTRLASLVALLVVTKSAYGDTPRVARRRKAMDLAAELRWAMLPPLSFTSERVQIAGVLEPAYEIAGDCFDYAVNGDTVHLAVLDAMGHGLEASRIVNLAVITFRHGRRLGRDLTDVFHAIDAAVAGQFGPERFVTGLLATLSLPTGRLRWLNAGHPRPILLRGTGVVGELAAQVVLPIGLGDTAVGAAEVALDPGDRILFYTDGVIEARSADGEEFGLDRLGDLLSKAAASQEPAAEMMRRLIHSVLAHEAANLRDDATLLMLGWPGPT